MAHVLIIDPLLQFVEKGSSSWQSHESFQNSWVFSRLSDYRSCDTGLNVRSIGHFGGHTVHKNAVCLQLIYCKGYNVKKCFSICLKREGKHITHCFFGMYIRILTQNLPFFFSKTCLFFFGKTCLPFIRQVLLKKKRQALPKKKESSFDEQF